MYAVGDRRPDGDVVLPARASEQRLEGREQEHRRRDALPAPLRVDAIDELCVAGTRIPRVRHSDDEDDVSIAVDAIDKLSVAGTRIPRGRHSDDEDDVSIAMNAMDELTEAARGSSA